MTDKPRCWAHAYTLGSLTTDQADAARAMRARSVAYLRDTAANLRLSVGMRCDVTADYCRSNASILDQCAEVIERMQPGAEMSGLCEPGS
jgi:hypothetical protein